MVSSLFADDDNSHRSRTSWKRRSSGRSTPTSTRGRSSHRGPSSARPGFRWDILDQHSVSEEYILRFIEEIRIGGISDRSLIDFDGGGGDDDLAEIESNHLAR